MSTETWELKKDLCRCCHSEGNFKNLAEPCIYLETAEIYSDMLKGCFEIEMVPVPGMLCAATYTICEGCILRLRDAAEFKSQVQSCEERFKDLFSRNVFKVAESCIEVKQESPDTCGDDVFKEEWSQDDDDDGYIESFNFTIDEQEPVKEESNTKKKKLKSKKTSKAYSETVPPVKEETEDLVENDGQKKDNRRSSKRRMWPSAPRKKRIVRKRPTSRSSSHENLPDNIELTTTDLNASSDITAEDNIASDIIPDADVNKAQNAKASRRTTARQTTTPKFRLNDEDYKKDGDTYQCARCEKKYDKILSLRFHVKTKHYKIPRYTCNICLKEFMTPAPLTVHKLEAHNVDDRFKCKACKGIFNTKVQLRKHINNFHMLGERYKCQFCDYESFSFEGEAYYTITQNRYECNLCGNIYASQPLVSQHYRFVHLKRRPKDRKCPKCDERIPAYLRASHLEKEHGIAPPTCGVCGKKFRFPCNVIQHQKKVHMGEKTVICDICQKSFFNKLSLRLHLSTHDDEKRFKCSTCGRKFRWENNLKDHVRIHTGDKRFVCPVCEKAFVQKSTLKQHAARNHPGVDVS